MIQDYANSPVLARFTRKIERPSGDVVTLAQVARLVQRYQKLVVKGAWPVSPAVRFMRHMEDREQ